MTLKQRVCGFFGHNSQALSAMRSDRVFSVKLKCKKCGYSTKWFMVVG